MQKLTPLVCLMLAACVSKQSVDQIRIAEAPPALTQPCPVPVTVTARTASQVETQWKQDRARFVACSRLHDAATAWYENRDKELVNGTAK